MKQVTSVIIFLIFSLTALATDWNENEYHSVEKSIRTARFADRELLATDFGASSGATAETNQRAINAAIEKCSKLGGGRVLVSGGTYLTGAIELKSHVNLVIDRNTTLQFAYRPELYPVVETRWEGIDCRNISPCIYAFKATDVGLTGEGTVDGGGEFETWWHWCGAAKYGWKDGIASQRTSRPQLLKMAEENIPAGKRVFTADDRLRPQLVQFNQCDGVYVEGVTLLRSPFWVLHPLLCKNVVVRNVKFINDGPNGDGCDPESCDGVLIEKCYFDTGDDCIAVKSGRNNDGRLWDRPSQNIIIRDCEMKNGHGGVVIGSEISGGCRNLYAENCTMDSPNLDRVIRIKTNTCRGGLIENINIRNIKVGQCREAVVKINLDYENKEQCHRGFPPTVRNVSIDNVTCEKSNYGVLIIGLPDRCNVHDINISDCRFNHVKYGNKITGETRDIRYDNYYVNNSLCLTDPPFSRFSQWLTVSEMKRQPRSYLLDFSTKPKWSYVMGIELEAMLDTWRAYGGDSIKDYCMMYVDSMISPDGIISRYNLKDYNLDNVRTGHFIGRMHKLFPEEKTLRAIKTLMEQLDRQPRTKEGVYWHKAIYAWQVWLDGIFMGLPFRVDNARLVYGNKKAGEIYDDAVDQLTKTYWRTLDRETGLNRHAWDETREMFWCDTVTGLSKHCWGRAQGWFTMALVEILDALPEDYGRRREVETLLESSLAAIEKWQDKESGLWHQVMDSPQREGNYLESTCSSMFTYAMLKAVRKGYADKKYLRPALKAYDGIVNRFIRVNPDLTISLTDCCSVAGLGPGTSEAVRKVAPQVKENKLRRDGSFEYYISEPVRENDAKGIGPFIWASLEKEML